MDILSSSSITNLINRSKQSEYFRRVTPLLQKKSNFSNLSKTWSSLNTKLNSFKSILSDMKTVKGVGSFTAKTAELTSDRIFYCNC